LESEAEGHAEVIANADAVPAERGVAFGFRADPHGDRTRRAHADWTDIEPHLAFGLASGEHSRLAVRSHAVSADRDGTFSISRSADEELAGRSGEEWAE